MSIKEFTDKHGIVFFYTNIVLVVLLAITIITGIVVSSDHDRNFNRRDNCAYDQKSFSFQDRGNFPNQLNRRSVSSSNQQVGNMMTNQKIQNDQPLQNRGQVSPATSSVNQ